MLPVTLLQAMLQRLPYCYVIFCQLRHLWNGLVLSQETGPSRYHWSLCKRWRAMFPLTDSSFWDLEMPETSVFPTVEMPVHCFEPFLPATLERCSVRPWKWTWMRCCRCQFCPNCKHCGRSRKQSDNSRSVGGAQERGGERREGWRCPFQGGGGAERKHGWLLRGFIKTNVCLSSNHRALASEGASWAM